MDVAEAERLQEEALATFRAGRLAWRAVPRTVSYVVHRNGRRDAVTTATQTRVEPTDASFEARVTPGVVARTAAD